ncbi:protein FAM171B [Esox lucius]|uniref:Protein FAM171B n=1 Tax=Esox lucius TaxID=8010 RepID=A0A3P8YNS1_ESOLU|nr:protein FAM171B [Esox lucius]
MSVLGAYLLLVLCYKDGRRGTAGVTADGHLIAEGSADQHVGQQVQHQNQPASVSWTGPVFALKVQVSDMLSRQSLSLARVEVYVNYTRTNSALTTEDGVVMLSVPYQPGMPAAIVAGRDRYLPASLLWKTTKMPIFTAVAVSLLSSNLGNICWFEDSVLITGKTTDALPQPRIHFPRSLLNLTDSNLSSVSAHLTMPQLSGGTDCYSCPTGLLLSNSGYSSVELKPVASVHAQLLSNGGEVPVTGPIDITLPLGENPGLRTSQAVPAWSFDRNTGVWMNRGTGTVKMEEGKLFWAFIAPHLGYWIAAPLPSNGGYVQHTNLLEFISNHSAYIVAILGGTLSFIVGVFVVILCCLSEKKATRIHSIKTAVLQNDKTTSTHDNQLCAMSSQGLAQSNHVSSPPLTSRREEQLNVSASSKHSADFNICVEDEDAYGPDLSRTLPQTHLFDRSDVLWPRDIAEQLRLPLCLNESLFLQDRLLQSQNQTVAILHAPGLWSSPDQPSPVCRPATLPRTDSAHNPVQRLLVGLENLSQTLPRDPLPSQGLMQGHDMEGKPGGPEGGPSTIELGNQGRNYTSLPESVSVPKSLNESRVRGGHRPRGGRPFSSELLDTDWNSEHALSEPRRAKPSSLTPRAWFVSLEGKPAAEICRNSSSVTDSKRRCKAEGESRDTSLDSGVDMNEPNNQPSGVTRQTTLVRSNTFVKRTTSHVEPLLVPADADQREQLHGRSTPHGDLPGDSSG